MSNPFVHSNFERIAQDDYQTIDPRCVYGFLEHFYPMGGCVDVCSPTSSGIVTTLNQYGGIEAKGTDEALAELAPTGVQ